MRKNRKCGIKARRLFPLTIVIGILYCLVIINFVSALNCQYKENQTYQEVEWGLYNQGGDYIGIPLEFKDFVGGQFNLNGCVSTPSFKIHNTLGEDITLNASYTSFWTKLPFYTDEPTNYSETISVQANADSSPLVAPCPDVGSGSIHEDSIKYIITSPELIVLDNKTINKQREVCKLCGSVNCSNDGVICNPLIEDSRCGSGICNIAGFCGSEKVVSCPAGLKNCNDQICLAESTKKIGESYLCTWECINTDTYGDGKCLKSSLVINLTSQPEEGDKLYYDNSPGNDESLFQYKLTTTSEIDRCLLLVDSKVIASSRDSSNINNFSVWNYDNFNFTEGNHNWKVYCNYTSGVYSYSENRTFYAEDYFKAAPWVTLTWPNDNQIFNYNYDIYTYFDLLNTSAIKNCSYYIDNKLISIWRDSTNEWIEINDGSTSSGKHTWNYRCTNVHGRTGYSENRTFYRLNEDIIPGDIYLVYDSANEDLSNVSGLYIGSENNFGAIQFIDDFNFSLMTNLSNLVNFSYNRIFVDSMLAPWLNKPATLVLYNLTFTNPRILKDGAVINTPFEYINGTLVFNVTGFSEYKAEETPTPPQDNGGGGGGSGGGGGGSGGGGGGSVLTKPLNTTNKTPLQTSAPNTPNTNNTEPPQPSESGGAGITGAVIGAGNIKNLILPVLIFIGLIGGIWAGVFFIRKKKAGSPEARLTEEIRARYD